MPVLGEGIWRASGRRCHLLNLKETVGGGWSPVLFQQPCSFKPVLPASAPGGETAESCLES